MANGCHDTCVFAGDGSQVDRCLPDNVTCLCQHGFFSKPDVSEVACSVSISDSVGGIPGWWYTTVIGFGLVFLALSGRSAYFIHVLRGKTYGGWRWGSRNKVHVVLVAWGIFRSLFLFIDPFATRRILLKSAGRVFDNLLLNFGYASAVSAYLLVLSFWLRVAKGFLGQDDRQKRLGRVFLVLNVLMWLFSIAASFLLGLSKATNPPLARNVSLAYNIIVGIIFLGMLVGFTAGYFRLRKELYSGAPTPRRKKITAQRFRKTTRMVMGSSAMIFSAVIFSAVTAAFQVSLRSSEAGFLFGFIIIPRLIEVCLFILMQQTLAPKPPSTADRSSGFGGPSADRGSGRKSTSARKPAAAVPARDPATATGAPTKAAGAGAGGTGGGGGGAAAAAEPASNDAPGGGGESRSPASVKPSDLEIAVS